MVKMDWDTLWGVPLSAYSSMDALHFSWPLILFIFSVRYWVSISPCKMTYYVSLRHSYIYWQGKILMLCYPIWMIQEKSLPSSSSSIWALASLEYMALRRVFLSKVVWSASISYSEHHAIIHRAPVRRKGWLTLTHPHYWFYTNLKGSLLTLQT